jgi:16S rRNA (adenine1518-N6/adenine1519-N6)-dimethyltransferase
MTDPRQTRSQLMRLFEQQGLYPRHDLGQNFLVDLNLHELIVRHARLSTADVVLEVGTGTGGLTTHLANGAGHVVSVECDAHVYGHALRLLDGRDNITLIHGDALANKNQLSAEVLDAVREALDRVGQLEHERFGPDSVSAGTEALGLQPQGFLDDANPWELQPLETTLKLVANLPYHVATPIISNLIATDLPWSRMVVTVQWEMAERMQAAPGTSDYSALTVWLQAQSRIQTIRKLPPSVFWPPPKVDSAVVLLERDQTSAEKIVDREFFQAFVRDVFTQRRKKLLGMLASMFDPKRPRDGDPWASGVTREQLERLFAELSIPLDARAEQLPVADWIALSNRLATTTPTPSLLPNA